MGAASTLLIIGVVIVAFLLFGTQIMAFANKYVPRVQSWVDQFLQGLGLNTGGDATGSTALGFTIYYTDGSHVDVNQNASFSALPLNIFYQGKAVASIAVDVKAKLVGTIGSWSAISALDIEFNQFAPNTAHIVPFTINITNLGGSWDNATVKTIARQMFTASQLNSMLASGGAITGWHMDVTVIVSISATINGGQSDFTSTPATGVIDLGYDTGGTQLSLERITVSSPAQLKP